MQGPRGEQGVPGPAGGPQGPQGEQGPSSEPGISTLDSRGIYEEVRESIVCIQYQNRECFGSGFYIDEEGTVVTALHVVELLEQYDWVEIWIGNDLYSQRAQYRVKHRYPDLDVATLTRVAGSFRTRPLPIATDYRIGEQILLFGFPGQRLSQDTLILTRGTLAALYELEAYKDYFLIDIVSAPGSSGGAIVNAKGKP